MIQRGHSTRADALRASDYLDSHSLGVIADFRGFTGTALQALQAGPRDPGIAAATRPSEIPTTYTGEFLWTDASPFSVKTGGASGGGTAQAPSPSHETADEGIVTVPVGGQVSGVIDTLGDHDTVRLSVTAGHTYMISMQGSGASPLTDSFLTLINPASTVIATDDDGGQGSWSLITFTAASTGLFSIDAAAFGDSDVGGYTIAAREMSTDSVPGTIASTVVLDTAATNFGFIETGGDLDVYKVTLQAGQEYSFSVSGGADYNTNYQSVPAGELDTRIAILDSSGNIVATNDDVNFPSDISSKVSFLSQAGGTYYLQVGAYPGQTGGYTVNTEVVDPADYDPLDSIDWGSHVASNAVTVYFAAAGETFDGTTSLGWSAYEKGRVMAALQTWADVTNVTFTVTNNPNTATFKLVTTETDEFLGQMNPPGESNAGVGIFAVNGTGWDDTGGLERGGTGFVTLVHEFGHGLGLAHPHDNGGTSSIMVGVNGPFGSYGAYDLNQGIYTTMSYNQGWSLHPDAVDGFPAGMPVNYGYQGGPGALDIAVVQGKYGADLGRNTGNTTYVLPTANAAGTFWTTIWDATGIDMIVQNGSAAALIDLTAATLDYSATGGGAVSYVDGIFGGFTIAHGTVIENATGGSGDDVIVGNSANNILIGNAGNDAFKAGAGNDMIDGGAGNDMIDGGDGIDTATYAAAAAGVTVSLLLAGAQATGGSGSDTLTGVEKLIGSAFADTLSGNGGDNSLTGGNGNDTLLGGAGNDLLDGGAGADTASYAGAASGVTINLISTSAQVTGGAGTDTLQNVENVIGSDFADSLTGNQFANVLTGGAGDDVLNGGLGNDTLNGGADFDTATYATATSAVRVSLTIAGVQSTLGAGTDTLSGIEGLTGSAFDDTLTGDGAHNVLTGNAGNDILLGGLGDDTLSGGAGNDTTSYASATTAVTVNLALTTPQNTGGGGIDTFSSIENVTGSGFDDTLTGSSQINVISGGSGNDIIDGGSSNDTIDGGNSNDTLKGSAGDDTLLGGAGVDSLNGGGGLDTLTGGTGVDTFLFTALGDSAPATPDRITDFASGDKLDVTAIDANSTLGGDQAFHFAAAFTHAAGEYTLAYNAGTNTTTAMFDTNGDAVANMTILFTGDVTALTGAWVL